jgi:hypothetical protein
MNFDAYTISEYDPQQKISYFDVRHVFFVQISVASNFSRNISKPLNKGD